MIKLVGECEALGYDLLCYWGWIFYESNFMCGSKGLVFKAGIANVQGFPLCCSPEVWQRATKVASHVEAEQARAEVSCRDSNVCSNLD